jgi:hypothetical protein
MYNHVASQINILDQIKEVSTVPTEIWTSNLQDCKQAPYQLNHASSYTPVSYLNL